MLKSVLEADAFCGGFDLQNAVIRRDKEGRNGVAAEFNVGREVADYQVTKLFAIGSKDADTAGDLCPQVTFGINGHAVASAAALGDAGRIEEHSSIFNS